MSFFTSLYSNLSLCCYLWELGDQITIGVFTICGLPYFTKILNQLIKTELNHIQAYYELFNFRLNNIYGCLVSMQIFSLCCSNSYSIHKSWSSEFFLLEMPFSSIHRFSQCIVLRVVFRSWPEVQTWSEKMTSALSLI